MPKLSQPHFLQLLSAVNSFHKRSPELTWSQAFMKVYRATVDKGASNPRLLSVASPSDAFDIARGMYCEAE